MINALYSESRRESLTEGKSPIRRERNPVFATQTQIMVEVNPTQEQSFKGFFENQICRRHDGINLARKIFAENSPMHSMTVS